MLQNVNYKALYKNLRREEVDKLFEAKYEELKKASDMKMIIYSDPSKKDSLSPEISKHKKQANILDKAARTLWRTICKKANELEIA